MLEGPMAGVWDMFTELGHNFKDLELYLGSALVCAAAIYLIYLSWRKYRTATSRI